MARWYDGLIERWLHGTMDQWQAQMTQMIQRPWPFTHDNAPIH
jgi:hypothetical protein